MRMRRRTFLNLPAACGAFTLVAPERAQAIGTGPALTLVVPFAAGGGPDVLTRALGRCLQAQLNQPVVVVNRPGAGGLIGTESVARSPADGRTLLASSVAMVIQAASSANSRVDPVRDFDHVSLTGSGYSVLVVAVNSPYRRLDDLLMALRRRPGELSYGSGGIGTPAHLCGVALLAAVGARAEHIPYRGSVDVPAALDSGDIQFSCLVQSTAVPLVRQGRLRALAVSTAAPTPALEGVPTLQAAFQSDDVVVESWSGLSAAAGSPRAWLRGINEAVRVCASDPGLRASTAQADVALVTSPSPGAFGEFVQRELSKFRRLAVVAGLLTAPASLEGVDERLRRA